MRNQIINDIDRYITYLAKLGLAVSVHGKGVGGLLEHNIHRNSFCAFIKTNDEAFEKCIQCQQKVYERYHRCGGDCFFGMCYAGVEEYVFFADEKTFVSVSDYGIEREKAAERIRRVSHVFFLDRAELSDLYEHGLKHRKEDLPTLKTLIHPLCHMLRLLQLTTGEIDESETKSKTFDSILAYVQRNMMQDISIRDIAYACACSESTVSHLFREYKHQPVKKYITTLRIRQAQKLLTSSDLPVGNVAMLCGFSDADYFSTVFKKYTGQSPALYRKENSR